MIQKSQYWIYTSKKLSHLLKRHLYFHVYCSTIHNTKKKIEGIYDK
jgi:hypothetical protein